MAFERNAGSSNILFDDRVSILVQRLYFEYESVLQRYRIRMRPCVIEVSSEMKHWGEWRGSTRSLRMSQSLIDRFSWPTVVEVLKHEMAHQFAGEVLGSRDVHGEGFRKACELLGVAEWARSASGELPDEIPSWRSAELSEETKRHLDRVNKLLSLASSANEHEATLAMRRAYETLAKHRLERVYHSRRSGHDFWFLPLRVRRVDAPTKVIFSLLRSFYFVRPILMSYFDAKDLQLYKGYDVCGSIEDLQMAEYIYEFLNRTLESLWEQRKNQNVNSGCISGRSMGGMKRSYSLGVLRGFEQKLSESRADKKPEASAQALITLDESRLEGFLHIRYPRLVKGAGISGALNRDSYEAGLDDGKKIVIRRPIANSDGNKGKLLT